jgi:excisionase family DNA binding protein
MIKTRCMTTHTAPPAFINRKELAAQLGVSDRTIRNWQNQGLVPAIKIGKRTVRFSLTDVTTFLKKRGGSAR